MLRRKGRALDATATTSRACGTRAASDQALFDRLSDGRSQLAALTLRGPAGARRRSIARSSTAGGRRRSARSGFRRAQRRVPRAVPADHARRRSRAIPEDAALLEFVLYRPIDRCTSRGPRPLRRLRAARTATAEWADLGEAADIDRAVSAWRRALRDPRRRDARRLARALDALSMQPVRALLGPASTC